MERDHGEVMKPFIAPLSIPLCAALGLALPRAARAGQDQAPLAPTQAEVNAEIQLTAQAVSHAVQPYVPDLRDCWLRHARRGGAVNLVARLELIIDPTGHVWRRNLVAPGSATRALEQCVYTVVGAVQFPFRRGYTEAVVPLLFLRTRAPGAGPRPTCWSPRGCPTRRHPE